MERTHDASIGIIKMVYLNIDKSTLDPTILTIGVSNIDP